MDTATLGFILFEVCWDSCGEGNGNPLQCSCLENPRDRVAWLAAVYGVAQSRTRLKRLSSSSSSRDSWEPGQVIPSGWMQGGLWERTEIWKGWPSRVGSVYCLFRCRFVLEYLNIQLVLSPSKIRECQWIMMASGIWLGFSRWHLGSEFSQNFLAIPRRVTYVWDDHDIIWAYLIWFESQEAEWLRGCIRNQTPDLSPGPTA